MNNELEINAQYKFDNCKHKSAEQKKTIIRRCPCQGGDYEEAGYQCEARNIFNVNVNICEYCHVFEKKDAV